MITDEISKVLQEISGSTVPYDLAQVMRRVYTELINVGFNKDQALQILISMDGIYSVKGQDHASD